MEDELIISPSPSPDPITIVNEITVVLPTPEPTIEPLPTGTPEPTVQPTLEPVILNSVDSGDVSGQRGALVDAFIRLLGDYRPQTVVTTVSYADGSSSESVNYADGLAALDIPWIASFLFFMMFFYGLLRLIGGWFRR